MGLVSDPLMLSGPFKFKLGGTALLIHADEACCQHGSGGRPPM